MHSYLVAPHAWIPRIMSVQPFPECQMHFVPLSNTAIRVTYLAPPSVYPAPLPGTNGDCPLPYAGRQDGRTVPSGEPASPWEQVIFPPTGRMPIGERRRENGVPAGLSGGYGHAEIQHRPRGTGERGKAGAYVLRHYVDVTTLCGDEGTDTGHLTSPHLRAAPGRQPSGW